MCLWELQDHARGHEEEMLRSQEQNRCNVHGELVPNTPYTATGVDKSVSLAYSAMLPEDKMPICSIAVLPIVISRLPGSAKCADILPIKAVLGEIW